MSDFLLSPETAKFISGFVAGTALAIFALRFGLAEKTRMFMLTKVSDTVRALDPFSH